METIEPRRRFLKRAWFWLTMVALGESIAVAVAFLWPRRRDAVKTVESREVHAGPVERFEKGSVTPFKQGHFYLVRLDDGGFLALSSKCTHLGCTVPWASEKENFTCPCHGSVFDMRGDVLQAPAPRALDLFRVRIDRKNIVVDTAKPLRRERFAADQIVYPESA